MSLEIISSFNSCFTWSCYSTTWPKNLPLAVVWLHVSAYGKTNRGKGWKWLFLTGWSISINTDTASTSAAATADCMYSGASTSIWALKIELNSGQERIKNTTIQISSPQTFLFSSSGTVWKQRWAIGHQEIIWGPVNGYYCQPRPSGQKMRGLWTLAFVARWLGPLVFSLRWSAFIKSGGRPVVEWMPRPE